MRWKLHRWNAVLAVVVGVSMGCGAEMVRPRAAGEKLEDRPDRALVIGQFDLDFVGFEEDEQAEVHVTRHRLLAGEDEELFTDEVPDEGRTFALWVRPGVFCFGRPVLGVDETAKPLGKGQPCAEVPKTKQAYYVGSVVWHVKKKGDGITAELEVADRRESVMGSPTLVGIYPETALVSVGVDPEKAAAKYKR